jgi:PIN domain nuclease of toxin-antitoxin system
MRLLLDTHSFLWFTANAPQLSGNAKTLIENPENDVLLSIISIWEIAILVSLGRVTFPEPLEAFIRTHVRANQFQHLGLKTLHATAVATLPFHHRDPFDRMLAAQALQEALVIVSKDAVFDKYGVNRLW